MYESLTKYLEKFARDEFGTWIHNRGGDGTLEHPYMMSYVRYSDTAMDFRDDVYNFVSTHEEMDLIQYQDIIEANGIEWSSDAITAVAIKNLNAKCILAMMFCVVVEERFCDGLLIV